jgi:acyl carrier protein
MPGQATPREILIDLVATILKRNGVERPIDAQADLVNQGLTSVDMVHLMLAIEAAFDITIPQSGLTPENFRSITTIEAMLAKLTAPAEASS